jgi:hypothetical protein
VNPLDILGYLPAQLDWMVLFKLSTIRQWAEDFQMKEMFRLAGHVDLQTMSHVVLSSQGRFLAPSEQSNVFVLKEGQLQTVSKPEVSLFHRHRLLFEEVEANRADCLGFAVTNAAIPVLLHLVVEDGEGHARAFFRCQPCEDNYELLEAVGIRYLGGHATDLGFVASFRNRISTHLEAASLAGYSRPGNCNQFFINHGVIDSKIESGLLSAAEARVFSARAKGLEAGRELARRAATAELAMTCQPPPPRNSYAYGDLVPLGFLLAALDGNAANGLEDAGAPLRDKLAKARQGMLWAFHTDRLVTATDSALVLQGLPDCQAIEALEQFSDGNGAYFPQLWAQNKAPGRMAIRAANAHWCQPDFATTCLIRGLRARAGLPTVTPLEYLAGRFHTRAGLFFANPYLVDWALACALSADEDASQLKDRLRGEMLAGMNADYSFGAYDVALSTSFAILALAALGCRGRLLRMAQLRLVGMMDPIAGTWPEGAPFYSTKKLPGQPRNGNPAVADHAHTPDRVIAVNDTWHELTLYRDAHFIISTAVAVMALGQACDAMRRDIDLRGQDVTHARYRCTSYQEYVAGHALRPYIGSRIARSCWDND